MDDKEQDKNGVPENVKQFVADFLKKMKASGELPPDADIEGAILVPVGNQDDENHWCPNEEETVLRMMRYSLGVSREIAAAVKRGDFSPELVAVAAFNGALLGYITLAAKHHDAESLTTLCMPVIHQIDEKMPTVAATNVVGAMEDMLREEAEK